MSCPTCGRTDIDLISLAKEVEKIAFSYPDKSLKIAVMGCVVNGPGEGKHADLGITGAEDSVIIFKHGAITKRLDLKKLTEEEKIEAVDKAFIEELQSL